LCEIDFSKKGIIHISIVASLVIRSSNIGTNKILATERGNHHCIG